MDKLIIEGGTPLKGTIDISGSKNAALPIIMASIAVDDEVTYTNVPDLRDIHTTIRLLNMLGRSAELEKSQKRAEQEQKKKEEKMNKILFIISVVCALPVVSDIFEIIEFILELFLGRGLNEFELLVVRGLCPGAVLLILVLVLLSMAVSNLFNKKRD